MKLILDAPASWRSDAKTQLLEIPAGDGGPGVVIEILHPALRPAAADDDWMMALLLKGISATAPTSVQPAQTTTNAGGWSETLLEATVDGGVARLAVFYQSPPFAAAAVVRAPSAASMTRHRDEIMRVLRTARPDFTGGDPVARR